MSIVKCMCMDELCVVVHTENASFQLGKEEVSWVQGLPGLPRKTLSQINNQTLKEAPNFNKNNPVMVGDAHV